MKHTNRNSGVFVSLFSLYFKASVSSCSLVYITRAYLLCNVVSVVKLFFGELMLFGVLRAFIRSGAVCAGCHLIHFCEVH
jgi:hypothetical protein